ncbi:MAG: amidophosphoribosyltransferase [Candidatus Xenolissoclinum pacificiensis L6]|uniref:Amidophosphoribosyltransferase n=1 Tax=Candidatus Xenolissoclinum pacificiensis L6 TaxID=1401685 RepID=W2UZP3_9RICK|nr:MAG: amidophosphoribosyltransferase [Candidatus Xenolissoclinum pacificiensis L6]
MTKLREKCGVFCVQGHVNAVETTVIGLKALQHRGHESFGIFTFTNSEPVFFHEKGYVRYVEHDFSNTRAIGHVRYSTSGSEESIFPQPASFKIDGKYVALSYNGNIVNTDQLHSYLYKNNDTILSSDIDSEIFVSLLVHSKADTLEEKIQSSFQYVQGAFSIAILTGDSIIAVRDVQGIRPLVIGKKDGSYAIASETCALHTLNMDFIRDVLPGEILTIKTDNTMHSIFLPNAYALAKMCVFEYIYFARPDSTLENLNVYNTRKNIGVLLAQIYQLSADMVIPMPDSGIATALGYSQASNIPIEFAIVKNSYVGRTFIDPNDKQKALSVKLQINRSVIHNKKVIIVDDSIVRGNTMKAISQMLKQADAQEIHLIISSPAIRHSCFYGIDTPNTEELISNSLCSEKLAEYLGITSVKFLPIELLYRALGYSFHKTNRRFCDACFTGDYSIEKDNNLLANLE